MARKTAKIVNNLDIRCKLASRFAFTLSIVHLNCTLTQLDLTGSSHDREDK